MAKLTTKELLTRRALGSYRDEDAVAWALGQVPDQPPLPNLAALACLEGLLNHFEVEELLRRALAELGIHEPPQAETYGDFLRETAEAVIGGRLAPHEACTVLADAHGGDMDRSELQPFWLLSLGRKDLQAEGHQFYYPGLTLESFAELVQQEARQLLAAIKEEREDAG